MIASDARKTADAPNLTSRPEWRITKVPEAKAPSELTITHINQSYNLWVSYIKENKSLLLIAVNTITRIIYFLYPMLVYVFKISPGCW